MENQLIINALNKIYADRGGTSGWGSLEGYTFSGLTWTGPGNPPTQEELDLVIAAIIAEDNAPSKFPLTPRQLRLGLVRNGVSLDLVEDAIAAIPDVLQRDEAWIYWDYSTTIRWEHPMTQTLMALVGITQEQATQMWMIAKDYEI